MNTKQYGISAKIEGLGYMDKEYALPLHDVKSKAGKAFHAENVQSVCVYDRGGVARLYLKKTPNGVVREVRDDEGNLIG